MSEEERNAAIRHLSNKLLRVIDGKRGDIVGAAFATAVGRFLMEVSSDEKQALGGLAALTGDMSSFIRMSYLHMGTRQ